METDVELAKYWGVSRRTVFNWRKAGAPLHDTEAMISWKAQHCRVRRHNPLRTELTGSEANQAEKAASQAEPEADLEPETDRELGIGANVRSLQKAERSLARKYRDAINVGDSKASFWFSEWMKCSEQMRKGEKDLVTIQTEQELVVPTAEVTNALGKICSLIRAAVDALPNRVTHKVANLPADSVRETMNKEAEILLRNLHDIPVSLMKLCAKDPLFVKGMTKEEIAAAIREVEAEFSEIKAP
jgi:phage terminase Nu1 subunit (DNA packaging protein)